MAAALLPLPLPLALRAEFPLTTICAFIAHALPRPPPQVLPTACKRSPCSICVAISHINSAPSPVACSPPNRLPNCPQTHGCYILYTHAYIHIYSARVSSVPPSARLQP